MKIIAVILIAFVSSLVVSCKSPPPVYVPVYVPTEKKVYVSRPRPKPVESAENFRAVEKPTTYSR